MQYINADIRELGSFEEATNGFSFFGLYRDPVLLGAPM